MFHVHVFFFVSNEIEIAIILDRLCFSLRAIAHYAALQTASNFRFFVFVCFLVAFAICWEEVNASINSIQFLWET